MKTIEEVLKKLDEIILWCKENKSPAGYFACTYRIMKSRDLPHGSRPHNEQNKRNYIASLCFLQ
ncbi:hypothetical protein [Chryseobacterium sp. 22458]|uniref:hypothetical protein n=1 Tax=Chryseobacterium sp. 22458 TaxID=3453921 RepID=UPI003F86BFBC